MSSSEIAYEKVKILVKDFRANESKFLSPDYSEADVRKDFIDKFFFALGWDVYHDEQKNPYEQEVKIEKGVYVGKQQKRADYAFHLAPNFRDVKFYVEAKKPSRNLSNADNYFQSIRYGWNAGTQITFLTDFEELHILDCRIKPDISSILNYKIKKYHYADFLNEEKFSEIYWLLSREAVANNSLEKFAESLPKPKGKAIQKGTHRGIYQSIDEAFLEELDEIRDSLAKAFKKANPHLESEPLTEMTQRMIDRLVFIRFLEDKQIEPDHYVSEFANSKTAWKDFKIASRKLDAKYNGVVFKKHTIDSDNFIAPDDKTFSLICEGLAHLNSPYNFDIIPIHILGSIYERFLGKVVIATDKRVRIEEKPEVRKAGGVYYTPQYIVNYIVDNTVGKLIEGKTPKEISGLRFADISCGSGSFLITVFDRLLEHHRKWYQDNPEQAKKDGCYFQDGKWVLSLKQKQKILTNNIYGVDLDHQAVEVTQLSLYLKLLEDETTATAQDTWVMFKEQLLPNLNNNIVCGNSLIGTDILESNLFNSVETRHASSLQEVDELKLKPMNFEDAFPEVMRKGGFDAIVGNPPYRMIQPHNTQENLLKYIKEKYEVASFKIDLFHLFINQGLKLTKKEGYLSYITPTTILNNVYAEKLRKWILANTRIKFIVTSKERIFPDADVYTTVFVFQKSDKGNNENKIMTSFELQNLRTEQNLNYYIVNQSNFHKTNGFVWNILLGERNFEIIQKTEKDSVPLEDITFINRGLITGDRNKYFSNIKINEQYIEILAGADVFRYYSNQPKEYVLFKRPKTSGGCWDKEVHLAQHKIIIRQIGFEPTASIILDPIAVTGNIFTIRHKSKDINVEKFVLAIINSSLIEFYWKIMFADFKNSFPQVTIESIAKIPIKGVNQTTNNKYFQDPIVKLVDQMLESKKQLANVKTESEKEYLEKKCAIIDKQIDQLVYELYGLTEEEIKIVEGI